MWENIYLAWYMGITNNFMLKLFKINKLYLVLVLEWFKDGGKDYCYTKTI